MKVTISRRLAYKVYGLADGLKLVAIVPLLVAAPAWGEDALTSGQSVQTNPPVQHLNSSIPCSSTIDQVLSEHSARLAALESAAAEPLETNDRWFSISIALLGVVTFIHALRLRRLK